MDPSFSYCSALQVEDIVKLRDICLKTVYFQEKDKFYQQKEGMAIESSLSLVISETLRKQHWIQQTTNPLNGTDISSILLRFGHMDQQDCNKFFS
jgi:hypothetical protein